jgi:rhodanese-related sulfurtransferase
MSDDIDAATLKVWLAEDGELALIDVRERGQFGERHPFFAVSLPYSRFELDLPALVPNRGVRLVLCDEGDGISDRAARRAAALGYRNVYRLSGGVLGWERAGFTLYAGVNVPSKAFGELVEHVRGTPRVTAQVLQAMRAAGEDIVILDGRPFAEYRKMSIPGGICCPNGELVVHIGNLAPNPKTKIIINCAGRTRSIIGAQTLIDVGIPNPVYALENGTQGWFLAGLALEHGASRRYGETATAAELSDVKVRARTLAHARGVPFVPAADANRWLTQDARTTYLLDVRTPEEYAARAIAGFVHAPGGQLVQATDQWVGTRGARLVLLDEEEIRAPVTAAWLRQLGHQAFVLEGGVAAAAKFSWLGSARAPELVRLRTMAPSELAEELRHNRVRLIDLRPSMAYRNAHLAGAVWSIRPRIAAAAAEPTKTVVLVADDAGVADLAARDLAEASCRDVRLLAGGHEAARDAGLPMAHTPDHPADADCIDFLFFTHARHDGNAEAARQYLAWEIGLIDQLDAQERASLRVAPAES